MDFTVVDDASRLDGAGKDEVRQVFCQMVQDLPAEGNATAGLPPANLRDVPRYTHCLYDDIECLQSFSGLNWDQVARYRREYCNPDRGDDAFLPLEPDPFVIIINCEDDDQEKFSRYPGDNEAAPEIPDGVREVDMSWMPIECRWLVNFYGILSGDWDPDCWFQGWFQGWQFSEQGEGKAMRPWRDPPYEEGE